MATRVRLPPGVLQEVGAGGMAQRRTDERRRSGGGPTNAGGLGSGAAMLAGPPMANTPGVSYLPGTSAHVTADDISALLLGSGASEGAGDSAHDSSLIEVMLNKTALSAGSDSARFSVPWDTNGGTVQARDYLRSVMSQMNQELALIDPTDAEIQQMISDPDAYIARTAGAGHTSAEQLLGTSISQALEQFDAPAAAFSVPAPPARARKLAQGTSHRDAQNVGRFEVSGTPRHPVKAAAQISAAAQDIAEASPPLPACPGQPATTDKTVAAGGGDNGTDAEVPLQEIVETKQAQAREMKALCDRLQMLVASAKEIAAPSSSVSAVRPAAPRVSAPCLPAPSATPGANPLAQDSVDECATSPAAPSRTEANTEAIDAGECTGTIVLDALEHDSLQLSASALGSSHAEDASPAQDEGGLLEGKLDSKARSKEGQDSKGAQGNMPSLKSRGSLKPDTVNHPRVRTAPSAGDTGGSGPGGGSAGGDKEPGQGHRRRCEDGRRQGEGSKPFLRADASRKFVGTVAKDGAQRKTSSAGQDPACTGRKVSAMAGLKQQANGQGSTGEELRLIMGKLAGMWNSVGSIFSHFDRPDQISEGDDLKGDNTIDLDEFTKGVHALKLGFTDAQINKIFGVVDADGNGTIDHKELETVLRDCGVLKSVAVKRVPKSVYMMERQREEASIAAEARAAAKQKRGKAQANKPIDPPGMSATIAEGLRALEERVEALRSLVKEARGSQHQFDLLKEQYAKAGEGSDGTATSRDQVFSLDAQATRAALLTAGAAVCAQMMDSIKEYKERAEEVHEFSVELIRDLPRDYRVVWKAAVCAEIDEKGGLVRVLNEEVYECEQVLLAMHDTCREWRLAAHQPKLDYTIPKPADGHVAQREKFGEVMGLACKWVKDAVSYGFADAAAIERTIASDVPQAHSLATCADDLRGHQLATQTLAAKLAPVAAENSARDAMLQEHVTRARASRSPPHSLPSVVEEELGSVSVSANAPEWTAGVVVGGDGVGGIVMPSWKADPAQVEVKLRGHDALNYQQLHEQLALVEQARLCLAEDNSLDATLSSIEANTSIDEHVKQLVSNRIHRLAVQVKDEVAAGATGDQGEADAEQTRTKSKKKPTVGKVKSGERGREETATKGTAPERDKGPGAFAPATGRNKSVWSKQLEDLAVKAAVAKAEASKSVAVEPAQAAEGVGGVAGSRAGRKQSVRRSTKPPPSRRLADVPRGRNSLSCTHGSAHSNRGAALLDTRVRRDSVLPTGCTALLTRNQSQVDAGRSWLSHPAAGGSGSLVPELLSPGGTHHEEGNLRQQYGACGVVFELRLHLAGAWTGVAEANFVRELAAAIRVPSDRFKVAGHASRLVPGCVEVELYSEHEWGQTVIDSVTVLASDPSSPVWALPNLAKVTVQGMVFEKSTVQGSPPKEDLFVEALSSGPSPQLASGAWEQVHAPMLREHHTVPASPEPDNAKDLPGGADVGRLGAAIGMPAAAKKAASRRSLDFQGNDDGDIVSCEIQGEGAGANQAHLAGQRGLKHRKDARDLANVMEDVRLVDSDEEAVTERVLRYLSHHLLARVETDGGRTGEGLGHSRGFDRQQEQEEAAGACSSLAAGLLGIDGLMFLIEAGVDIDEDAVLQIAEGSIEDEAVLALQKARENPLNTLVAPDSSQDRALLPLQQPGLTGTRRGRVVVAESIAPFAQSRNAQDDEVAQELIMSLLVQGMEQGDMIPTDPRRQAALDSEAAELIKVYELRQEERRRELEQESDARRARLDSARQSVASLISRDGEAAGPGLTQSSHETRAASAASSALALGSSIAVGAVGARGAEAGGVDSSVLAQQIAQQLARQPALISFDQAPLEQHHAAVEKTLVRIADSMDALTSLTKQLADRAEVVAARRPPLSPPSPGVGALQMRGGGGAQLPPHSGHRSTAITVGGSASAASESVSVVSESVHSATGSDRGSASRSARGSPMDGSHGSSEDSLASAIHVSDYTPKTSMDDDSGYWTPVRGAGTGQAGALGADLDVETIETVDADVSRAVVRAHSVQTSIDFDRVYASMTQGSDKQLQTSIDFDRLYASRQGSSDKELQTSVDLGHHDSAASVAASASAGLDDSRTDSSLLQAGRDSVDGRRPGSHAVHKERRKKKRETSPKAKGRGRSGARVASDGASDLARQASQGSQGLTEPIAQTLISTLRSLEEEVAALRQSRLVSDAATNPADAVTSSELCLVPAAPPVDEPRQAHADGGRGQGDAVGQMAMPMEEWLFASHSLVTPSVRGASDVKVGRAAEDSAGETAVEAAGEKGQWNTEEAGGSPDDKGASPDASTWTSLSEGEFRDPASLLALESSAKTPGSPPEEGRQPPALGPAWLMQQLLDKGHDTQDGAQQASPRAAAVMDQTSFPLTFGPAGAARFPWREGGQALSHTGVMSRQERRAERKARRAMARSRTGLEGTLAPRESLQSLESTGSMLTSMGADGAADVTGDTITESELSDGEVASGAVWWLREGAVGEGAAASPSDASDGELRQQ